jgi:hypothetical protein
MIGNVALRLLIPPGLADDWEDITDQRACVVLPDGSKWKRHIPGEAADQIHHEQIFPSVSNEKTRFLCAKRERTREACRVG